MTFNFENLGVIQSAHIELKGLTVITGLNDTGKSFLSKAIYSIVKTINEAKKQQQTDQVEFIQNTFTQAYVILRQMGLSDAVKLQELQPGIAINEVIRNIQSGTPIASVVSYIEQYRDKLLGYVLEQAQHQPSLNPPRMRIHSLFHQLLSDVTAVGEEETIYKNFFNGPIIAKLFQNQINNIGDPKPLLVTLEEGDTKLLEIEVNENLTTKFQLLDIISYKDATLIETPIILQLARFINISLAFGSPTYGNRLNRQRSELPYHYFDMTEKIFAASNSSLEANNKLQEFNNEVSNIIKGNVRFEPSLSNFVFVRDEGEKISPFNMASGVKSFGLLQLLLNAGAINRDSIIIIDEPEVHLHPKWQVDYAKLIVDLSIAGITIIVSSHSPYFLKALASYVSQLETSDITKFYFGTKDEVTRKVKFDDVSNNLDPIFKALAEPLYNLPM